MPFPEIEPIVHIGSFALQWGPLAIRWYALAYVAGILIGWRYASGLLRNTARISFIYCTNIILADMLKEQLSCCNL